MEIAEREENHLELSIFTARVKHFLIEIIQCFVKISQHSYEPKIMSPISRVSLSDLYEIHW